jgi:ubiquinone/menaquinone biosynthesis C-methylase UbiE
MQKEKINQIREAFNKAAPTYAKELYHELYFKNVDIKLLDLFCERVDPNLPICEIGCGPGEISTYLRYKHLKVVGIDISEEMIRIARELNPHIDFQTGNVFALDYSDNFFSGILAPFLFVNYEMEDIKIAFLEIKRVLIPNGIFYMSFHEGNDRIQVEELFAKNNPLEFIYLNVSDIARMLEETGFEIIEWIVRSPYATGEHKNKRAYIFAKKKPI